MTGALDAALVRELARLAIRLRLPPPARFTSEPAAAAAAPSAAAPTAAAAAPSHSPPLPSPAASGDGAPPSRGVLPSLSLQIDLTAPLLLVTSAYEAPSLCMPLLRIRRLHLHLTPPAATAEHPVKPSYALWSHIEVSAHLAPQRHLTPLLFDGLHAARDGRNGLPAPSPPAHLPVRTKSAPGALRASSGGATTSASPTLQVEVLPLTPHVSASQLSTSQPSTSSLEAPSVRVRELSESSGGSTPRAHIVLRDSELYAEGGEGAAEGGERKAAGEAERGGDAGGVGEAASGVSLGSPAHSTNSPAPTFSPPHRMIGNALDRLNAEAARTIEYAVRALTLDEARAPRPVAASHEALLQVRRPRRHRRGVLQGGGAARRPHGVQRGPGVHRLAVFA